MAEFKLSNSKFFLNRKNVVWSYDNKEYIFAKNFDKLMKSDFDNLIVPFSNFILNDYVNPNKNHMYTYITLFLSSNYTDKNLIDSIRKYSKRKSYKFGLRGYSVFRIILFNNSTNELFYNKDSKDTIKFYREVLLI
ncbi:hypothetical protein [Asaccharospora irregularis]|uniref:DUF8052 domain-containing protein n=1 Tax=Asaccharospora irregularis DSM 2635 TaxID=1121321 RepID=A0A1M5KWH4_9FIRM|nr:hypothetical protein SAMN04488530_103147 [Asaccharospora irregularis DSM 2635]